jgi:hypothetical protein
MRSTPKTIQPPRSELDKAAKERIVEQANSLFTFWGVNISSDMIAHYAHTNVDTIKKHFGTRERLVFDFLQSPMKQAEQSWKHIEQEHPNDPEAQLRRWVLKMNSAAYRRDSVNGQADCLGWKPSDERPCVGQPI